MIPPLLRYRNEGFFGSKPREAYVALLRAPVSDFASVALVSLDDSPITYVPGAK
jgi:hypothetical protein